MSEDKRWERLTLLLVLALELWLFSGAFNKYFNHDSLFYIINAPRSWADFQKLLTAPDPGQQYRPLTLGIMSRIVPLLGLDPHPYHWIPLIFHLLNTLLFYMLLRRLIRGSIAILAATAFWGLHSVAGWITYDVTCISDFLLASLYLASLLIAVESARRRKPALMVFSLLLFVLSLLTKEAAITFPLALFIALVLARVRDSDAAEMKQGLRQALKSSAPAAGLFLAVAVVHALLLLHWLQIGMLYQQGTKAAYEINPWANLAGKMKYFFWAFNLPDVLHTAHPLRDRFLAFALMIAIAISWLVTIVKRKGRLSIAEWGGLIWLCGLNIPALLLSHRLAKWYLYEPLFGLALALGVGMQYLPSCLPWLRSRSAQLVIPLVVIISIALSSYPQTRSYLRASDAAYASDTLKDCVEDFRTLFPSLPDRIECFVLPSFEKNVLELLSAAPTDYGQLFNLYYPHSRLTMSFAHKGASITRVDLKSPDFRALYYLDGHFYDLTRQLRINGKVSMFVLPTFEGKIPPLLEKEPIGGRQLHETYVRVLASDAGANLPDDHFHRGDYWILRYLNGHFNDETGYYKGRRRSAARRVLKLIDAVRATVSRDEYYPDYDRFATPSGGPVFFPTPGQEIFTQIGGSTAVIPVQRIPPDSMLRFDISMMYDLGDGVWAELRLRTGKNEVLLYREYLKPNPKGKGLRWKEVALNLHSFENQDAEIILKCYNDRGKTTIADWLNWRDMVIEDRQSTQQASPESY